MTQMPSPNDLMPSSRRFTGKTVLVTGASSGIGRAIAVRLAQEGAKVAINYPVESERAAAEMVRAETQSADAITVQADVSSETQVQTMFRQMIDHFGRLDILINNAGIQKASPSDQTTLEDWERIVAVDLRGPFLCCREAIAHFLSRPGGGVIVNNSSVHQIIPKPQYLSYSMSKSGIDGLTRTLALEYAEAGIRVNTVGPGAVITPINSAWKDDPKARAVVESHIPMGRAAEASEIAAVFAFLASDEASYITGQTLFACGGLTLFPEFRTTWSS